MKVALLSGEPIPVSTSALVQGWRRAGAEACLLLMNQAEEWPDPTGFDLVCDRVLERQQHPFHSLLSAWLAQAQRVTEPLASSSVYGGHKERQLRTLQLAGLPVPEWELVSDPRAQRLGGDLICKPLQGGRGYGVRRVHDLGEAQQHQEQLGRPCLLQRYLPHDRCIRVLGSADITLAVYGRLVDPRSGLASVSLGSERVPVDALEAQASAELARAASSALGYEICGADIIYTEEGLWLLEVNLVPGCDPEDQQMIDRWVQWLIQRHFSSI